MDIRINGIISDNDNTGLYTLFGYENFCPKMLDDAVQKLPADDNELNLLISSPGGSAFAGFDIYSAIKNLQAKGLKVKATVTSLAASAASTIMAACEPALVSPVAQVMIHQPMCFTDGNVEDHKDSIEFLNSVEEGIINGYVAKAKGKTSRETFKKLVDKSTWMSAGEAVRLGLADGILGEENFSAGSVMNSVSDIFGAVMNGLEVPTPAELKARYEAMNAQQAAAEDETADVPSAAAVTDLADEDGNGQEAEDDSWKLQAQHDLESKRFGNV